MEEKNGPSRGRGIPAAALSVPLFLILILSLWFASLAHARCPDGRYTVLKVMDGRSFEVAGGICVRLIGLALPEGEEASVKAREALSLLVDDGVVTLEGDLIDRDQEGFFLRYAYGEEIFVNVEMIRLGFACFSPSAPNGKHDGELAAAETAAGENGRTALWSSDCSSGCFVYVGSSGTTYHVYGCPYLEGASSRVCRDEALQKGYAPCGHCGGACDDGGGDWSVRANCFIDTFFGSPWR